MKLFPPFVYKKRLTLIRKIKKHDILYWNEQSPEISDEEYDKLRRNLKEIDPNCFLLHKNHPAVKNRPLIKISKKLLSLDKVFDWEQLLKWMNKVKRNDDEEFEVQPKYDGCASYFNGRNLYSKGHSLRSDEKSFGSDITDKMYMVNVLINKKQIPLESISHEILGELLLTKSKFRFLKKITKTKGKTPWKNSRNACAGLLNRKEKISIYKPILLVPYGSNSITYKIGELNKKIIHFIYYNWKYNLNYPLDGLVIKLKDKRYKESLGYTASFPRGEMALKFPTMSRITKLIGITYQIGKNNITPVGVLQPIILDGCEVKRVTFHNFKFVLEKGLKIGDSLEIEKAGDIIPHVKNVYYDTEILDGLIQPPKTCPACGEKTKYEEPNLICTNPDCIGKQISSYSSILKSLGILYIQRKTIEKLLIELDIKDIADFISITRQDLEKIKEFKELSIIKILNELNRLKELEAYKILFLLNINHLGLVQAKKIMNIYDFPALIKMDNYIKLQKVEGIAQELSVSYFTEIQEKKYILYKLLDIIKIKNKENKLGTICFSGKGDNSKSFLQAIAVNNGFEVVNSLSKNTDLLVLSGLIFTNKYNLAKKYNIPIINEETFMKKYSKVFNYD